MNYSLRSRIKCGMTVLQSRMMITDLAIDKGLLKSAY
jgi:hypothetical protein